MDSYTLDNVLAREEKLEKFNMLIRDAQKYTIEKIENTKEEVGSGLISCMMEDFISRNAMVFFDFRTKAIIATAKDSVCSTGKGVVFSRMFRFKGDERDCFLVTELPL